MPFTYSMHFGGMDYASLMADSATREKFELDIRSRVALAAELDIGLVEVSTSGPGAGRGLRPALQAVRHAALRVATGPTEMRMGLVRTTQERITQRTDLLLSPAPCAAVRRSPTSPRGLSSPRSCCTRPPTGPRPRSTRWRPPCPTRPA